MFTFWKIQVVTPEKKRLVECQNAKDPIFCYRKEQTLKKAQKDFDDYKNKKCKTTYDVELPGKQIPFKYPHRACGCCFAISLGVSVIFVSLAYLFYALATDTDELFEQSSGTITAAGDFFGWPEGKSGIDLVKNLYGGMMLGLVFGFMDNFGLFYGMDALGDASYELALSMTIGLMHIGGKLKNVNQKNECQLGADAHEVAESLLAGIGNTFSDVLGVALGSAALLISKSGLGQDPSFWPLDLLAIAIGCTLGVILPAVAKYSDKLGVGNAISFYKGGSLLLMVLVFAMVFLAGGTHNGYFIASATIFGLLIIVAILFLIFTKRGGPTNEEFISKYYKNCKSIPALHLRDSRYLRV